MKSDIVIIDNQCGGFGSAVEQTRRTAEYKGLSHKDSVLLELFTEEMLSMAHSVTGEMKASFWLECEGDRFDLHLTTKTVMDADKRAMLIASTTSKKNEITTSFLGRLRDAFEQAMVSQTEHTYFELPKELEADLAGRVYDDPEWDRYEQSVLLKLADDVKIAIRGGLVEMTVSKTFH